MIKCSLCEPKKLTHWHHEDDICYICDCETCGGIVIVLKTHRKPIKNELEHMLNKVRVLFNMDTHTLDFSMKKNKNHFHFHLREFGGADEPLENHYF